MLDGLLGQSSCSSTSIKELHDQSHIKFQSRVSLLSNKPLWLVKTYQHPIKVLYFRVELGTALLWFFDWDWLQDYKRYFSCKMRLTKFGKLENHSWKGCSTCSMNQKFVNFMLIQFRAKRNCTNFFYVGKDCLTGAYFIKLNGCVN